MANAPDFRWAAFYYPEILAALIARKAVDWPEHTETDDHDPVIQVYRAMSIVSHLQAVRLDHGAREQFWATMRLRSSFVAQAALVDYQLATASAAEAELVGDVTGKLTAPAIVVRGGSLFGTEGSGAEPAIVYEADASDLIAGPTGDDGYQAVMDDGGVVSTLTGAFPAQLWGGVPAAGDALYIGASLMFNKVAIDITGTPSIGLVRWEYRDDLRALAPDLVTVVGGGLEFVVETLIGATKADGLSITVTCLRTGISETVACAFNAGHNRITTATYLGQIAPTTSASAYRVQADWIELPGRVDGTLGLLGDGDLTFTLPEAVDRRWARTDPASTGTPGYWIRARVVSAGPTPAAGDLKNLAEPKRTTWSLRFTVRQGQTVEDRVGATDAAGSASQAFQLTREPFMSLTSLAVGGDAWTTVLDLQASLAYDKHVRFREQPDGSWLLTFGDGVHGKLPPAAADVVATYRVGGAANGNVGPGAIVRDRSGNNRVRNVRNPRAATGWTAQEGTTDQDLEALRDRVPAAQRANDRAVSPPDYETHAIAFRTLDGSQVAVRARAVEEAAGPKTMGVICAGPGGVAPSTADLGELEIYFNGREVGLQRVGGIGAANMRAVGQAFTPIPIDVTAVVEVLSDYVAGAQARINASLGSTLTPVAKRLIKNDLGEWVEGKTYLWAWGGSVDPALVLTAIATSVEAVVGITLTDPAAPIALGSTGLPVPGVFSVTVVGV